MTRKFMLIACMAMTVGLSACQGETTEEPTSDVSESAPVPATEPAAISFTPPEDYTPLAIFEVAHPLAETYEVEAYRLNEAETDELAYVASYLLPGTPTTGTQEEQKAFVQAYDEQIGNEDTEGIPNLALVHGNVGVYRWAKISIEESTVFQLNTFLFHSNQAIVITCQYVEQRDQAESACQQITDSLLIPEEWSSNS